MNKKQRKAIREFNARTVKRLGLNLKDGVLIDRDGIILGKAQSPKAKSTRPASWLIK